LNVPSFAFLAFTLAVAVLLLLLRRLGGSRRGVLLAANLAFVLSFGRDPRQLAPFGGLLLLGFLCLKLAERRPARPALWPLVTVVVLAFCALKQYAFVPPWLTPHEPYLTVGMSYVFFRIVHLIVDAGQDTLPETVSPFAYLSYTLSFTSLVSGPIQLYPDYRRTESEAPLPLDGASAAVAAERIVTGFFKVVALSPLLTGAHDRSLGALLGASSFGERVAWAALVVALFPFALYVNFSGYTDFVIGCARLLGIALPENFDRPFTSTGFIEFWSRWHMTLSNWLKVYVYSPLLLALMRRFPHRAAAAPLGVAAFFVTFFLVGAWHGQTAMFLVFGLLQGGGVAGNKLFQLAMIRRLGRKPYAALCASPAYAAASRGLTFTWFAFSLLWFWASGEQLRAMAGRLGAWGAAASLLLVLLVAIPALGAAVAVDRGFGGPLRLAVTSVYARVAWCSALAVVVISIAAVLQAPAPHIIYKGF
jgi:alginate O-acetyltransferase complex protein AlgI